MKTTSEVVNAALNKLLDNEITPEQYLAVVAESDNALTKDNKDN